jgi:hypothetical protein
MHVRYQTALHPEIFGLRGEARTPDLKLPKLVRYQLRYAEVILVGVAGIEPATSSSRKTRAARLRHTPKLKCFGSRGWERSNDLRLIKTALCLLSYATT